MGEEDEEQPKYFYVKFKRDKNGDIKSSLITLDLPLVDDKVSEGKVKEFLPKQPATESSEPSKKADEKADTGADKSDFAEVTSAFCSVMDGYRNFIPLTLQMAPHLAYQLGFKSLERVAKEQGSVLADLTKDDAEVFSLKIEHYAECARLRDRMQVSVKGARHLPEVTLIGLVSVYDAMLGRLLRTVFSRHEEIIFTSEKNIKFSELMKFGSIEQAKQAIIDKEVETALRESHHDQFDWMQKKFAVKLKEGLPVWPVFVEVCERRNLVTHTGGQVSDQYLASGKENKFDVSGVTLGQKLEVSPTYYDTAANAVYEVGAKLCHVFWRKFAENQRGQADDALNMLGFSLIQDRNYELAEKLLQFGVSLPKHASDATRRMMVVNLANAVRLQKRSADAKAILDREDWSAVEDRFKLCVAAVRGDEDELIRLMNLLGPNGPISAEEYRNWPVFRLYRTKEKFASTFQHMFGSRLLAAKHAAEKLEEPASEKDIDILEETASDVKNN